METMGVVRDFGWGAERAGKGSGQGKKPPKRIEELNLGSQ